MTRLQGSGLEAGQGSTIQVYQSKQVQLQLHQPTSHSTSCASEQDSWPFQVSMKSVDNSIACILILSAGEEQLPELFLRKKRGAKPKYKCSSEAEALAKR